MGKMGIGGIGRVSCCFREEACAPAVGKIYPLLDLVFTWRRKCATCGETNRLPNLEAAIRIEPRELVASACCGSRVAVNQLLLGMAIWQTKSLVVA